MKKIFICGALTICMIMAAGSISLADTDRGPAEITINPDGKKPALFPHASHQETITCGECHHGMAEGKQLPYTEGQKIQRCAECHNENVLAGKKDGKLKLDTIKGAGHGNCLKCHKEKAKESAEMKDLKKCTTCHPKKKK